MTLKVLLDPIYTAKLSKCSSNIQFVTWVSQVLEKRQDVFFYWLVDARRWADEAEREWMPKHPNIRYLPVPQHIDRMKEYLTVSPELDRHVAFNGPTWDYDVLVTVRAGLVPLLKMLGTSPRGSHKHWTRQVWLIEEMPLMTFKSSVANLGAPDVQDRFTVGGYLAADRAVVMSYHERPKILSRARELFNPSAVLQLAEKLKPVVPVQVKQFALRSSDRMFVPGQNRPFTLSYVGRFMQSGSNFDTIYSVMTNQWIVRGGDRVRMVLCTPQHVVVKPPPDYMELKNLPRDEFWRVCREEMDLLIVMHREAGFLLSVAEPLSFGVPAVIKRAAWAEGMLGEGYPYFVDNELEAYTVAKAFYEDYAGAYAPFAEWYKGWFVPTYEGRFKDDLLYTVLDGYLDQAGAVLDRYRASVNTRDNEMVRLVADSKMDDLVLRDAVLELGKGKFKYFDDKLRNEHRNERGLAYATNWNEYRLALKAFHGFVDAGVGTGHLKRAQS